MMRLIQREAILCYRSRADVFNTLLFFVMIVSVFPLTADTAQIPFVMIGPGVIWMAVIFAIFMALPRLFQDDSDDGTLSQMRLSAISLPMMVSAKIAVHDVILIIPLLMLTPFLALLFDFNGSAWLVLMATLCLGTPTLYVLGALLSAMSIDIRHANLLVPLVLMPFFIPILIFACGAISAAQSHTSPAAPLLFLAAILILALSFLPRVIASVLSDG